MSRLLLSALFTLAVITTTATGMEQTILNSRRISTADGLSSNTVYDIIQDNSGFIWMGAAPGLCRYDGYDFVNYYNLGNGGNGNTDSNIGNIYNDSKNGLIWVHTSTFTFACYNQKTGKFTDYTGRNDENKSFQKTLRTETHLWMYDIRNGVRSVTCDNGKFTCNDYNTRNSKLKSNYVVRLIEDRKKNVWVLTDKELAFISPDGHVNKVREGKYITGSSLDRGVICLAEGNRVEIYGDGGKQNRTVRIPASMGNVKTIRSQIVWQGKWLLFGSETVCVDIATGKVTKPDDMQVRNGYLMDTVDGYYFEANQSGNLYIFPPKGKMRTLNLIPDTRYTAERNRRFSVARNSRGIFYIATYGNGLFALDMKTGRMRHFTAKDPQPVIDTDFLSDIMIDRNDNIWVCQETAGVTCIFPSDHSFETQILPAPTHRGDWTNYVRMIAKDKDGKLMVSTRDNKIYSLDPNTLDIHPVAETNACAYSGLTDRHGRKWITTYGDGLYIDNTHYNKAGTEFHIPGNKLQDIVEDCYGRIWIASYEDGLIVAEPDAEGNITFRQLLNRSTNEGRTYMIEIDRKNRIWVASNNGLYVAKLSDRPMTDNDFTVFNTADGKMPFNEARTVVCASDGRIWTGGRGSGVVVCTVSDDLKSITAVTLNSTNGIADNNISSIAEDRYGNIWAATENGLSRISPKNLAVKTYVFGKNSERNIYSNCRPMTLANGNIMFSTRYGITMIKPKRKYGSDNRPGKEVFITDMRINGTPVKDCPDIGFAPCHTKEISLPHNLNTLWISFSNFDFADAKSARYQYRMDGVESKWCTATNINHVEYRNLPPGTYRFRLRSASGNRKGAESILTIHIAQPWYNTWWAWMIYLCTATAAGLYICNNARERLRLHQQMAVEKQLTEFRMSFFTNITHEFRTPLAIIQGAADKLTKGGATAGKPAVVTIRRGVDRLLKLVNQLMEFRKISTENMKLAVEEGDIIETVKEICNDFWHIAEQKRINLTFTPFERHHKMVFDSHMTDTMVYNLLSNAIKYTPEKGSVDVRVKAGDGNIMITVEDSGPGISKEQQDVLFQPFMHGYVSKGGMGIGLYVAHSMARIHKGSLTYSKKENGDGSVFTVTLPANADVYAPEEYKRQTAVNITDKEQDEAQAVEMIRELKPEALNNITIAVIEDDPDMMEQIKGGLNKYFNVTGYTCGKTALDGIAGQQPALVICDIMLPDICGYDIVKQLKVNDDTALIPVIMLTALDDDTHHLKGLKTGADDYMVKPCNFNLLVARSIQLIRNTRKIQSLAQKRTADSGAKQSPSDGNSGNHGIITSVADKNFIQKMQLIIAQNISNPDFTVDMLAQMMNMGRTKFFNKTKELLGISPNKYLQNERMRIAADLLAEGELTVAEISYRIGIQDASYFNKCFKSRYGVAPSKYKREADS
ncbi:hybrid sensor histidine kinase/response regulator transcription factor [Xylanibacter muris]|uniref:histidine kinase n=2 Tax=Xylanibacter muris TaxID=2736290 RepID=A0ABX2ANR6_9BACT|nr:hybrid sensor histidine kinase/response regulator transcription factor [Xylanibacter muris]NPD92881.1 response regulator [Xylanibacter muris]